MVIELQLLYKLCSLFQKEYKPQKHFMIYTKEVINVPFFCVTGIHFFFVWSLLDNSKYNNVLSDSPKYAIKVH